MMSPNVSYFTMKTARAGNVDVWLAIYWKTADVTFHLSVAVLPGIRVSL
jgi:hypothetical protein